MPRLILSTLVLFAIAGAPGLAQDRVFSGPQPGEKLKPFKVRGVLDGEAGKELDFVSRADGKPILLVFVHEANRPSIGLTRVLMNYAMTRAKDGLVSGTVWLADDPTEAEATIKRMRHALAKDAPIGISPDGKEGPGAYGLNRNVTLTILVGKDNKVTANFALVQPSIPTDLPKILKEVVAVAGGTVPKLEDLPDIKGMIKSVPTGEVARVPDLMRAVIRQKAEPADVDRAAAAVEELAKKDEAVRKEVGRIASTVVGGGKLENYGTAKAQEYLRKWAREFGPKERPKLKDKR